jgi:hypothetical protein
MLGKLGLEELVKLWLEALKVEVSPEIRAPIAA